MLLWDSLLGMVEVSIACADPGLMLNRISKANIQIVDCKQEDVLSVRFKTYQTNTQALERIVAKSGGELTVIRRIGAYWSLFAFIKRPVLVATILFFVFLTCFLPTKVLFIEVVGNTSVSKEIIQSAAERNGLCFGADRRSLRSEELKNNILQDIEWLQWVGINTYGCTAVITVKEKEVTEQEEEPVGVRSIVAAQNGIIRQMTVLKGNPLCRVGEAVEEGQVLVSGYTDCVLYAKAEAADAEIYGDTIRYLKAVSPLNTEVRREIKGKATSFGLLFGKKLINLWKDSRISDPSCVKMYQEYPLTLPGGFQLPVSLVVCTGTIYDFSEKEKSTEELMDHMALRAATYLEGQMLAGSIQDSKTQIRYQDGLLYFSGEYACMEIIGKIRYEEILTTNEE